VPELTPSRSLVLEQELSDPATETRQAMRALLAGQVKLLSSFYLRGSGGSPATAVRASVLNGEGLSVGKRQSLSMGTRAEPLQEEYAPRLEIQGF
jgi:hypothetical protein